MTKVMLALGDFRFSIDSAAYQSLRRSVEYRWAEIARVGTRPGRQFVGIGGEEIALAGVIYPAYRGGLGQVAEMRRLAGLGEPLLLVDGQGQIWGKFCISRVDEDQAVFFSDGTPKRQDFSLSLVHYGEE